MYNATSVGEMELAVNRRIDALKGGPPLLDLKGSRSMIHMAQGEGTRRGLRDKRLGIGYTNEDESDFDDAWSTVSVF